MEKIEKTFNQFLTLESTIDIENMRILIINLIAIRKYKGKNPAAEIYVSKIYLPEEKKEAKDEERESADWFWDTGIDLKEFLDPRKHKLYLEDITGKFPIFYAPNRKEAYLTDEVFK